MTSIPPVQIPPPQNWQDFESLCCDLWARIWNDQNTQKNGRGGQVQHGVDIYGCPSNAGGKYYGIQCKGKDNYSGSILTVGELNVEVEKASNFSPRIDCFIIATTSAKDARIERRAREITEDNRKKGSFTVHVYGWADIVEKLSEHQTVIDKYYSWAIKTNNPDEKLFESWYRDADIKNLQINSNAIPFQLFNIRFTGRFLNIINSYLMKIETNLRIFPSNSASQSLKDAIVNFNYIATDMLKSCYEFENKYNIESDVYTYWIDTKGIPYNNQGQFIEFKKGVLKVLFYNLVKAANYVIYIRNSLISGSSRALDLIAFIESYNYNYPLLGEPHPSPEYYPLYSDQEMKEVELYQGLESIKQYVHDQVYSD